jgi:hypothetical protein
MTMLARGEYLVQDWNANFSHDKILSGYLILSFMYFSAIVISISLLALLAAQLALLAVQLALL